MLKSNFNEEGGINAEIIHTDNGNTVIVKNMSKKDAQALVVFTKNTWKDTAVYANRADGSVIVDIFDLNNIKGSEELVFAIQNETQSKNTNMARIVFKAEHSSCIRRGCGGCPFYVGRGTCAAHKYEKIDKIITHLEQKQASLKK